MTENVLITIKGCHRIDGEDQEPVITRAKGKYAFRNGHHYVRFEEVMQEDSEGSRNRGKPEAGNGRADYFGDAGSKTKSMVKFAENYLCVTRDGVYSNRMEFEEGRRRYTRYQTPMGTLEFEVETNAISYEENSRHIEIIVDYTLHSDSCKIQDSRVVVTVQPFPFL